MLRISPHTGSGENDEDTVLNETMRFLSKGLSFDAQKAIQDLVRLHSQKNDLVDVNQLLGKLKNDPEFKDGLSQVGYEELLRLVYAATTDETWGESKDVPGRWRSLMSRMVRAQNEYHPGDKACAAGTFNAILESLSEVHPDVLIVMSFKAMMQQIVLNEEDEVYEERIKAVLKFLGDGASKDKDYKVVVKDFTKARIEMVQSDIEDIENELKKKSDHQQEEKLIEQRDRVKRLKGLSQRVFEDQVI